MRNTTSHGLESVLEKLSRSLSDKFGIHLVCQGDRCCTDGKTIYLPSLPDDIPKELLQAMHGYTDHETAHIAFRSDMNVATEYRNKHGPNAFVFLNMLEDARVEEAMRQRFPGSGFNLAQAYRFILEEIERNKEPLPPMKQLAHAVYAVANRLAVPDFVGPAFQSAVDAIQDEILRAVSCNTTREVAVLAEKAWQMIGPMLESASRPMPTSPCGNEQAEDKTPGLDGSMDTGRQSSPPGGAGSRRDAGHPGKDSAVRQERMRGKFGTAASHPGQDTAGADRNALQTSAGVDLAQPGCVSSGDTASLMGDLAGMISSRVNQYAQTSRAYRIWTARHDRVAVAKDVSTLTHGQRMASVLPHVSGVRQRLLQTLLAEPRARWRGDLEEGSINPRVLHRVASPAPGREGNLRAFRKRVKVKKLHTAVALLIDESNSMRHSRLHLASETALVFCEALSRLNIAASVIGFSTIGSDANLKDARSQTGLPEDEIKRRYRTVPLSHTIYKRFDEQFVKVSGRMDNMAAKSLTPLGESMLFAARELAARHEERKVLFVLTDGKPVVGIDPEDVTFSHAKAAIKRIESSGINVALLGIMEPSVMLLHHRSVVINRLDELPRTAMRQLQKILST